MATTTALPGKKISKAELLGYKIDAAAFDNAGGELFAGLRILKLNPGEAAGPFTLTEILRNQDLNQNAKKKMKPVDVYVCTDASGKEIRMPVAAGFVRKAEDANLSPGDSFLVKRVDNYVSKAFGKEGAGYELRITARASGSAGAKSKRAK